MDAQQIARLAAAAAEEKKAIDVLILDVSQLTVITDYFVIASGTTATQVQAVAEAVEEKLKAEGIRPLRRDGTPGGQWLVLDYGGVMVHILQEEQRDYYDLEGLWYEAPRLK
ncbi:MAG: ribosome silencing factor [Bacillota bacterium]|nr:ribosome silencing factor [Bacillota bacterium]